MSVAEEFFQPTDSAIRVRLLRHEGDLTQPPVNGNGKRRLTRQPLAGIERRSIVWLDKPFLQQGAFHLLAGKKGVTKGTYTCGLAARISRGECYDGPRSVLLVSSEDSVGVDIGPRVDAAGGDDKRIHIITSDFRLPRDLHEMKEIALEIGDVGLIAIDPLGNHLLDRNTDAEGSVRDAIAGLNNLADELDCVVIGVRHLGKDVSRGALASVLGSTAWIDVPRVVIVMAADDEDVMTFHAQVVAGNRSPKGAGRVFHLELVDVGLAEPVTYLRHDGDSTKDVEDLLGGNTTMSLSKSASARKLILDLLDEVKDMESDALTARICQETALAAGTIKNLRTALRDEGMIRMFPDKDESGKVVRWNVARTKAPRPEHEARASDVIWEKPEHDSQTVAQTFGSTKPGHIQITGHTSTVSGLSPREPDHDTAGAPPRARAKGDQRGYLPFGVDVDEVTRLERVAGEMGL